MVSVLAKSCLPTNLKHPEELESETENASNVERRNNHILMQRIEGKKAVAPLGNIVHVEFLLK